MLGLYIAQKIILLDAPCLQNKLIVIVTCVATWFSVLCLDDQTPPHVILLLFCRFVEWIEILQFIITMDKGLLHPFIHERDLLRWFELSFCFIIISRYSLFNKSSLSPFVQHKLVHIFHKKCIYTHNALKHYKRMFMQYKGHLSTNLTIRNDTSLAFTQLFNFIDKSPKIKVSCLDYWLRNSLYCIANDKNSHHVWIVVP